MGGLFSPRHPPELLERHRTDVSSALPLKEDAQVQRAAAIEGLGPLTASAMVATVGDFKQF